MGTPAQTKRLKMVRGYTLRQGNDYTPVTLSLLSESVSPVVIDGELVQRLTDEDLYNYRNAFLHFFLEMADDSYKKDPK